MSRCKRRAIFCCLVESISYLFFVVKCLIVSGVVRYLRCGVDAEALPPPPAVLFAPPPPLLACAAEKLNVFMRGSFLGRKTYQESKPCLLKRQPMVIIAVMLSTGERKGV
jgi:hypothetical protein